MWSVLGCVQRSKQTHCLEHTTMSPLPNQGSPTMSFMTFAAWKCFRATLLPTLSCGKSGNCSCLHALSCPCHHSTVHSTLPGQDALSQHSCHAQIGLIRSGPRRKLSIYAASFPTSHQHVPLANSEPWLLSLARRVRLQNPEGHRRRCITRCAGCAGCRIGCQPIVSSKRRTIAGRGAHVGQYRCGSGAL